MNKKTNIILLTLLLMVSTACAVSRDYPEAPPYNTLPDNRFPLAASFALYQPFINDEQFQWLKEAGFNMIRQSLTEAETDSLLVLAEKYDMDVNVSVWRQQDPEVTPRIVERYKDRSRVWGYCLGDEPSADQFGKYAELREIETGAAPHQNAFFNLLPAVKENQLGVRDYYTYVDEYVRTVNPPLISLDIYPVKLDRNDNIYIDPALYPTMEVISQVSRDSERPFWAYVLCNSHWRYPKPTREYLRFQAFTALAYGAQGLIYFTYQLPDFDKEGKEFSNTPIDREGNRTDVWYMVKDVNSEINSMAKVFNGAEVLDVAYAGKRIPDKTKRVKELPSPFRVLEAQGDAVLVSHIRNGESQYLVLVNQDVVDSQKLYLSHTTPVVRLNGDGSENTVYTSFFTLEPGGYLVLRF